MEFDVREVALKTVEEALKLGVSEAEAFVLARKSTLVRLVRGGEVEVSKGGESLALGVRIAFGKRVAVGGGSLRSLDDVRRIVEQISKIARASSEDPNWRGLPGRIGGSRVTPPYDPLVEEPPLEELLDSMGVAVAKAKGLGGNLEVTVADLRLTVVERAIASTSLDVVAEKATRVTGLVAVKAVEGGTQVVCHEYSVGFKMKDLVFEELAEKASTRALRGLRMVSVETGRYALVLTPKVSAAVLDALITPAVSADNVQKGRSPLAGRIGEEVLDESITVVDDPTVENLYTTTSFDDEGVATRPKTVFRKGVLETFLYDTYTAKLEGRESTGNAVRASVTAAPRPSPISLIVEPGREPMDRMVEESGKVLVVYETVGEWLSNPVNGYLNATITYAELYEKGVFKGVVRGPIASGNIYELLKNNLLGLSRETEISHGILTPAIMIDNVTLSLK